SVVIPVFNRRGLLPRTLQSVWRQSFTDFEIIVVDDGSSDGTIAYLESRGDRIQLLRQTNHGPGVARNVGAARARGDYLAFLDSDDLWFPWTLKTFAEVIADHNHPDLVAAKLVEFRDDHALR